MASSRWAQISPMIDGVSRYWVIVFDSGNCGARFKEQQQNNAAISIVLWVCDKQTNYNIISKVLN